jgi:prepilin-type N-terminal cleavage/methylation domain-containing protein
VLKNFRNLVEARNKELGGSEKGFTLIELLIVIVVLGILAAIVIFSLTGVTGQSNAAACNADGKSIEIAADAYSAANGSYPAATGDVVGTGTGTSGSYLQSWPSLENGKVVFSFGTHTVNVKIGTAAATAYTAAGGCASL